MLPIPIQRYRNPIRSGVQLGNPEESRDRLVEAIFLLENIGEIELGRRRQPMIGIIRQEAPESHPCGVELTTIELRHRRLIRLLRSRWTPTTAPDESTKRIGAGAPIRGRHPGALGLDPLGQQDHGALNLAGQRGQLGQLGLDVPKLPCNPPPGVHHHLGLDFQRVLESLDVGGQLP